MPRIDIKISFVAVCAAIFCFDTGNILLSCIICAVIHEFGHLAAIRLCGGKVEEISVSVVGAYIKLKSIPMMSYKSELLSALAGPAISVVAAFLFASAGNFVGGQELYVYAGISMLLGIINLIPLFPLDGGRILRCATMIFLREDMAIVACRVTGAVFVGLVVAFCVYVNLKIGMQLSCIVFCLFLIASYIKDVFVE